MGPGEGLRTTTLKRGGVQSLVGSRRTEAGLPGVYWEVFRAPDCRGHLRLDRSQPCWQVPVISPVLPLPSAPHSRWIETPATGSTRRQGSYWRGDL